MKSGDRINFEHRVYEDKRAREARHAVDALYTDADGIEETSWEIQEQFEPHQCFNPRQLRGLFQGPLEIIRAPTRILGGDQ